MHSNSRSEGLLALSLGVALSNGQLLAVQAVGRGHHGLHGVRTGEGDKADAAV